MDSKAIQTIILAGGRGTRLSSVVNDRPKPMVMVAEKPFIEWVIEFFRSFGILSFVVSLGHMSDIAQKHFDERQMDNTSIITVTEETPLGTGGAVMFARKNAPPANAYCITNGDSLLLADLNPALDMLAQEDVDGVIIGRVMDDTARYGTLCVGSDNRLLGFSEKVAGRGLINGGIYLLKDRLISMLPENKPFSIEREGFPSLLKKGARLFVAPCDAPFIDIGTPESYLEAEQFIKQYWKVSSC